MCTSRRVHRTELDDHVPAPKGLMAKSLLRQYADSEERIAAYFPAGTEARAVFIPPAGRLRDWQLGALGPSEHPRGGLNVRVHELILALHAGRQVEGTQVVRRAVGPGVPT